MKEKVTLLVDAENLIKQAFHGNNSYYNEQHIGGLYSFFHFLRRIIDEQKITKVIICWDGENGGKGRYDLYRGYKVNRLGKDYYNKIVLSNKQVYREENMNRSLLKQRVRIKQYAEELFFRQVDDVLTEADDLIGYYCTNLRDSNEKVIIYSNDRDFCQLLSDDVSLYLPNKKVIVTPKNYFLFFTHHPDNALLIKLIEGDDSDNIEGVEGFKENSLIKYFPKVKSEKVSIEQILNEAKEIQNLRGKKTPQGLVNLIEGKTSLDKKGDDLYTLNSKLMNLKEPFITDDAIEQLKDCKQLPLDDSDRGAKNLLKMMMEDGYINKIPGGTEKFAEYLQPFLFVVREEKEFLKKWKKS